MSLSATRLDPVNNHNEIAFSLDTREPYAGCPDAKSMLDDKHYPIVKEFPDFKLLERSSVKIGTITGEQLVYTSTLLVGPNDTPVSEITWEVYFDHGGLIYNLHMSADQDIADEAEADFEHILETFKFLD
jgi:hypothetical protein